MGQYHIGHKAFLPQAQGMLEGSFSPNHLAFEVADPGVYVTSTATFDDTLELTFKLPVQTEDDDEQ